MKNKETGDVLFVVVFTLIPKGESEEEKMATSGATKTKSNKGNEANEGSKGEEGFEPKAEDLD